MNKRRVFSLPVMALLLALLSVSAVYAKEQDIAGEAFSISNPVSVYGHVMPAEGNEVAYYMIEAEEQMRPLTAIQVTFTWDQMHSVWAVRMNGEQAVLGLFGAGTHIISLPEDVKEVGMLIRSDEAGGLNISIPGTQGQTSAYTGCYLSIVGDSLSSVELAGSLESDTEGLNVASKWWYIAAKEMGMNILVNGAVGSTGIGVDVPEGAWNSGLHKCTNLHTNAHVPDCIFVLLGMNDLFAGKDIQEVEREYRLMLDQMRTKYPRADIILFTYPYIGDGTGADINRTLEQYVLWMNDVTRRVGREYGLAVAELYECGINAGNIGDYVRKPGDIHPNRAGQALMGRAAVKELQEINGFGK